MTTADSGSETPTAKDSAAKDTRSKDGANNGDGGAKDPIEEALDLLLFAPLGLALEFRNLLPGLVERGRKQVKFARSIGKMAASNVNRPAPAAAKTSANKSEGAAKKDPAKKADAKKASAKKASAKKASSKKDPARKADAKKAAPKKATAKKTAAKKSAAKKSDGKKATAKRTAPKKATAKRTAPKRATPKKTTAKKTAPKRATAQKTAPKSATPKKTAAAKKAAPRKASAAARTIAEILPGYDERTAREVVGSLAGLDRADLAVVAAHEAANRNRVTVMNRVTQLRAD